MGGMGTDHALPDLVVSPMTVRPSRPAVSVRRTWIRARSKS
jgi:hypothetical protein